MQFSSRFLSVMQYMSMIHFMEVCLSLLKAAVSEETWILGKFTRPNFLQKFLKFIHFWNRVYENMVLQLMSGGASLERFGEKDIVFIK